MTYFLQAIIFIILAVHVNLFYVSKLSNIGANTRVIIIVTLGILIILLNYKKWFKRKHIFFKYIITYIIICIIQTIISALIYNQSILSTFRISSFNYIIILYFGFIYFINGKGKNAEFIIKLIIYFTLFISLIFLIQFIFYNKTSNMFLYISNSISRFGSLRIMESGNFIELGVIISVGVLISEHIKINKFISLMTVIFGIIEMIFVAKGRMGLILVLISIFIIIMISKKGIKSKLLICATFAIIIGLLIKLPIINNYYESFSSTDISTEIRHDEISYYLNDIKSNPILGSGFIYYNSDLDGNYTLIKNQSYKFYRTDVGLIGFTDEFGILGLLWYIIVFYMIIKTIIQSFKLKNDKYNIIIFGIAMILLLQSFNTLSIDDLSRFLHFPILLAFVEYLNIKNNKYKKI